MAKILHVIDELRIGGAQTHLVTFLRELKRRDVHEHHVVGLFGGGPIEEELRSMGVEVTALELRPFFRSRRFFAAATAIEAVIHREKPALVEAHLTWSRLLGLFAAWRAGVPRRIGFEQGDVYFDSPPFRLANFTHQLLFDRLVVCSDALGTWVRKTHGIRPSKIAVLHNCVDLKRFRPARNSALRKELRLADDAVVFCAVGTLGNGVNKRVDLAIQAIAHARRLGAPVDLLVCGDGVQRGALERLSERLGIARHVRFLGMRKDVPAVLAAADAFCHAAPFEPFGIVCIEAMAVGLPVVVPDTGGMREAVIDGSTGLVYRALDSASFGSAMSELAVNAERRQAMGRRGMLHAERHFSVERYVDALLELYGLQGAEPRELRKGA